MISETLASMYDVLLLWLASAAALFALGRRVQRRRPSVALERLWRRQRGEYSVSLLMSLPAFVTILALFIQCSCLMVVKLGTVYAAHAAGRAAAAWADTGAPTALVFGQVRLAATKAMAPFASGSSIHEGATGAKLPERIAHAFVAAYESFSAAPIVPAETLEQKICNAFKATSVTWTVQAESLATQSVAQTRGASAPGQVVHVTMIYWAPVVVPGLGDMLGEEVEGLAGPFYARKIVTTIDVSVEQCYVPRGLQDRPGPHTIGVRYDQLH